MIIESTRPKEIVKPFKKRRDEIVFNLTEAINKTREGTEFKKTTEKLVALRANKNPLLDDSELEYVYNECIRKGNFSYFYYITK